MQKGYMTVRIDSSLKKKVMEMAKAERRRFTDQVVFLMEKGLLALEQQKAQATREVEAV